MIQFKNYPKGSLIGSGSYQFRHYGNGRPAPRFVTVGANGSSYYSLDGETWTAMTGLDNTKPYYSVCYGNGVYVCGGEDGIYYSTDGVSYTLSNITSRIRWVCYGNGRFVGVGVLYKYYSLDGITWYSSSGPSMTCYSITYGNEMFVAITSDYNSHISVDGGISYTKTGSFDTSSSSPRIVYANGQFVASMSTSTRTYIYSSQDTTTWEKGERLTGVTKSLLYINNNYYLVGNSGFSAYSTDTITWENMNGLDSYHYYGLCYGNGKLICVGQAGSSYYSTNGTSWTSNGTIGTEQLNAICYG